MENHENLEGVFPCRYCQGAVRWLKVDKKGILVNAKRVRVLVPVMKSAGTMIGENVALMDEITYREVDAWKKHFCQSKPAAPLLSAQPLQQT